MNNLRITRRENVVVEEKIARIVSKQTVFVALISGIAGIIGSLSLIVVAHLNKPVLSENRSQHVEYLEQKRQEVLENLTHHEKSLLDALDEVKVELQMDAGPSTKKVLKNQENDLSQTILINREIRRRVGAKLEQSIRARETGNLITSEMLRSEANQLLTKEYDLSRESLRRSLRGAKFPIVHIASHFKFSEATNNDAMEEKSIPSPKEKIEFEPLPSVEPEPATTFGVPNKHGINRNFFSPLRTGS